MGQHKKGTPMIKVLYVEDEAMVQNLIRELFLTSFPEVSLTIEASVRRGISLIRDSTSFDLVITDGNLVDSTGCEVIEACIEENVPAVIMVSAREENLETANMLFAGKIPMRMLHKPFRLNQLVLAIEELIAQTQVSE